ncbi:hypothetical protein T265_15400, partial [Opisthorchis viverrini]
AAEESLTARDRFRLGGYQTDFDKYTHLQINLVFTENSIESLVYGILQLNVLHKGLSHVLFIINDRFSWVSDRVIKKMSRGA